MSMRPSELLRMVWESGAISVHVESGRCRAKWKGKAPSHIREPFVAGQVELGAWIETEAVAGRRYIWGRIIVDLVCVAYNDAMASGAPVGIVTYTKAELAHLRGTDEESIRQVHRVKKTFGGRVQAPQPMPVERGAAA